ncbi:MAG: GNAT family N-acetyltransferase [Firmicutes bacterium HGW-Firmicutes-15]|nr:MAG: GNAT family N-acetyltransferase [Firmicutes bacterium HGW-Firmicutes-15]
MEDIKRGENQFYIGENIQNKLAEITFYSIDSEKITIVSTYVSESLKNQGVALELVKKVVDYARQDNKKIIPMCSYAKKVLTENEEYKDLLK